ncbi:metallo proteinase 10 [Crepidotus variabilis]|uniref:Extracellular metalloproteinase n=1 Tax=Crepidotus variabilis TaxID=179855 RepID=A0A9P6E2X4_9AGAR|nr:metallo proteinase 10 [Crepidotus variabilis]
MVAITAPFFTLVLATIFTTLVQAAPFHAFKKNTNTLYKRHATHRVRTIGRRQMQIETYHPKTTFRVWGKGGPVMQGNGTAGPTTANLMASTASIANLTTDNLAWRSGYSDGEAGFGWIRQSFNGIPVANAVANIATHGNQVVSFGSSFIDAEKVTVPSGNASVSWTSVLSSIEDSLDGKYNGKNATLEYLVKSDGSMALSHVIQLQNDETGGYLEAFIDAHSGDLLSVTDLVAHASYTVLPITKQNFPEGLETLVDPEDSFSSPQGWHSVGAGNSSTTSGNNVLAFKGQEVSSETSPELNFNAAYDDTRDPTDPVNLNGARQNAFYILNVMHDFTYRYGFTEKAFNFQLSNFNKGGQQNDRVLVSVQDASGVNNANFATPPDGQPGVCRMFIWTRSDPRRDGTMENDIVIHEMTHGITNRMTGGGTGRCLQTTESGGLGEGWGDAMADWMGQTSEQTRDYIMASYAANTAAGLRSFPYSTNAQTNPLTYASLQKLDQVHEIGEVWANMLHNVYAALVDTHGFSEQKLTNPDGAEGNIVFMRLFIDSLAVQPCNPTFVDAKNAWIQADQIRYNGANKCVIAKAFASRGLGANADDTFQDDSTLPAGC